MRPDLLSFLILLFLCVAPPVTTPATGGEPSLRERTASIHAGFLYPNGVDLVGYTAEYRFGDSIYGYYTFGFPSLAAAGVTYYNDYNNNGPAATVGVGIGSVLYSSLVYQLRIDGMHFIKLGGGYTTGIAYSGIFPAASYEFRF